MKLSLLFVVGLVVGGIGISPVGAKEFVSEAWVLAHGGVAGEKAAGNDFYGTQVGLIQSGEVRRRAMAQMEAQHEELAAVPVKIEANRVKNSSVIEVTGTGKDAAYVRAYLDAVLEGYINLRREMRAEISQKQLNEMTDELLDLEREMRRQEEALAAFEKDTLEETDVEAKRAVLVKNLDRAKSLYEGLLRSLRELDLKRSVLNEEVGVSILDQAAEPRAKGGEGDWD
ncbi:MAG: hypothetical protein AAF591_07995 [Verrucomicrobiota bacterium]